MEFKDKTAFLTGAAQGIARATSQALAREGARVIMVDINAKGVEEAAAQLRGEGFDATAYACDVASDAAVEALGKSVTARFGTPDLIVNCAYIGMSGIVDDINLEDWRKTLDINVLGYVRVVKAFVDGMIARGSGYIVNVASPMGLVPDLQPGPFLGPYMASKGANIAMTMHMAQSLRPRGVLVSAFFPDVTRSPTVHNIPGTAPDGFKQALKQFILSGATPESSAQFMLAGLRKETFLIAAEVGLEQRIIRAAHNHLDPLVDTRSA